MRLEFRVATLNLPSQVRGPKSRLLPHPKRTTTAVRLWNDLDVEIVALQELATMSRATIRTRPRWGLVTTTNNVFPRRRIGNGIAYRKDQWALLDKDRLHIPLPGRRRGLRMAVALLGHRETGAVVVVLACHNPTRRDASEHTRQACIYAERTYAVGLANLKLPVIVAGDFNDGAALTKFQPWQFVRGAQHRVDLICGRGVRFSDARNDTSVHGDVTDHGAMPHVLASIEVPNDDSAVRRLPKKE